MSEGTIAWYHEGLGYGVIVMEDGRTVFVHSSNLVDKTKIPKKGDVVEFDLYEHHALRFVGRNIKIRDRS